MVKVKKVWGREEIYINTELYCYKKLFINKGYHTSDHYHLDKDETFLVESGLVELFTVVDSIGMGPGCTARIKPGSHHQLVAIADSVIIEISTHDDPKDSYRITESGKNKDNTK